LSTVGKTACVSPEHATCWTISGVSGANILHHTH